METLSLLIADASEEFRTALSNALQGSYRIRSCQTGKETLELLHSEAPDILILDLMLPELDGISLLQLAMDAGIQTRVLATTRLLNDYVVESITKLGVAYLMVKPCDIHATIRRIKDLSRQHIHSMSTGPDPRTHVSNLLITLGFSTKLKGYTYLREAILLMVKNPMQSITKELYPSVARICGISPLQVERSIRSAISSAWVHRDDSIWMQFFQPAADGSLPRPSNAVFISRLADRLTLDQLQLPLP